MQNALGRGEYFSRILKMADRQGWACCNCRHSMRGCRPTFEHEEGRGMGGGKRDDRIEIDGKPVNGASHLLCNQARGSKRTPIWKGNVNG
jgi:hypothetical protein